MLFWAYLVVNKALNYLNNKLKKAFHSKSLKLHPHKRPHDPNAHDNFQKLNTSYEILKDQKSRLAFDDLLRVKREKAPRQSQHSSKRRKMMSDLEERERAAFGSDSRGKDTDEEERIAKKLREEIARIIRAMNTNKGVRPEVSVKKGVVEAKESSRSGSRGGGLDLKVSWNKIGGEDYSAERLRELFGEFGEVEDVVIRSSSKKKKKGSAFVVMASKNPVVSLIRSVLGDLPNPLLVVPLQQAEAPTFSSAQEPVEYRTEELSKVVGAGFQAFEDSVLAKLQKV